MATVSAKQQLRVAAPQGRTPKKKQANIDLDRGIALRLKWTRRALGLSQRKIARELGVNRVTYGEYERATFRIPVQHALTLARLAHVNLDWIYAGEIAHLSKSMRERLLEEKEKDPDGTLRE